jgi:Tfp pilus assembly protein PilF
MKRVIALNPRAKARTAAGTDLSGAEKLPSKAQDIFAQLLKIDPNSADGHNGLADALANQHRDREALEEYKRVAAIDSSYPGVYYNMGVMQVRLKLYDDAIASLLKQRQVADDRRQRKSAGGCLRSQGNEERSRGRAAEGGTVPDFSLGPSATLQLLNRPIDSRQRSFPSQNLERLKQRRRILTPAYGHPNRLEHLSRLEPQFLRCRAQRLVQRVMFEFRLRQDFSRARQNFERHGGVALLRNEFG